MHELFEDNDEIVILRVIDSSMNPQNFFNVLKNIKLMSQLKNHN